MPAEWSAAPGDPGRAGPGTVDGICGYAARCNAEDERGNGCICKIHLQSSVR